jgi:CheY-like chemotaxis protein
LDFIISSCTPNDFPNPEMFMQMAMKSTRAFEALTAAAVAPKISESGEALIQTAFEPQEVAQTVARVASQMTTTKPRNKLVLWVDDRPDNNVFERQALEAFGVSFILSESTEDALEKIRNHKFDAIISDMGRPGDDRAGYTFLQHLRALGNNTPFIIYAGSRAPEHITETKRSGGFGTTNRPDELFEMVLRATNLR